MWETDRRSQGDGPRCRGRKRARREPCLLSRARYFFRLAARLSSVRRKRLRKRSRYCGWLRTGCGGGCYIDIVMVADYPCWRLVQCDACKPFFHERASKRFSNDKESISLTVSYFPIRRRDDHDDQIATESSLHPSEA